MRVALRRKAAAIVAAVSTVFTSVMPYSVSAEETSAAIVAEAEETTEAVSVVETEPLTETAAPETTVPVPETQMPAPVEEEVLPTSAAETEPAPAPATQAPSVAETEATTAETEPAPVYGNVNLVLGEGGGTVTFRIKGLDGTEKTFEKKDGSVTVKTNGAENVAAPAEDGSYLAMYEVVGTVIEIEAAAKTGYRIAEYANLIDAGGSKDVKATETDQFKQELVVTEGTQKVAVAFYELPTEAPTTEAPTTEAPTTETEAEETTEVETETEVEAETEEDTEAESDTVAETETEVAETEEAETEEIAVEAESETEEVTEAPEESEIEEETEEASEVAAESEDEAIEAETEEEFETESEEETEIESEEETEAETEEESEEETEIESEVESEEETEAESEEETETEAESVAETVPEEPVIKSGYDSVSEEESSFLQEGEVYEVRDYLARNVDPAYTTYEKYDVVDILDYRTTFVGKSLWYDYDEDGAINLLDVYLNESEFLAKNTNVLGYALFYDLSDSSDYVAAYLPTDHTTPYEMVSFDLVVNDNQGQIIDGSIYHYDWNTNILYVKKAWFEQALAQDVYMSLRSQSVFIYDDADQTELYRAIPVSATLEVDGPEGLAESLINESVKANLYSEEGFEFPLFDGFYQNFISSENLEVTLNGEAFTNWGYDAETGIMTIGYPVTSITDVQVKITGLINYRPITPGKIRLMAVVRPTEAQSKSINQICKQVTSDLTSAITITKIPEVGNAITFGATAFVPKSQLTPHSGNAIWMSGGSTVEGGIEYTLGLVPVINAMKSTSGGESVIEFVAAHLTQGDNQAINNPANPDPYAVNYSVANPYDYTLTGDIMADGVKIGTMPAGSTARLYCTHVTMAEAVQGGFTSIATTADQQVAFNTVAATVIKVEKTTDTTGYIYVAIGTSTRSGGVPQNLAYVQTQWGVTRMPYKFTPTTGTIRVQKKLVNDTYNLEEAVFTVYTDANCTNVFETIRATQANTWVNGAKEYDLTKTYYVKETSVKPADKIKIDPDVHSVVPSVGGTDVKSQLIITDDVNYGKVGIKKVYTGKTKLIEAVYGVYDGSTQIATLTLTGDDVAAGKTVWTAQNLTIDKEYTIKEISVKPADKITIDAKEYKVKASIAGNAETSTDTEMPGYVAIIKKATDGIDVSKYPVSGAQYTVYATNNNGTLSDSKAVLTIQKAGEAVVTEKSAGLTPGQIYYIKETKAPDGGVYTMDSKIYEVEAVTTVAKAQEVAPISIEEGKKKVTLKKSGNSACAEELNDNAMYSLEGAEFEIYDDAAMSNLVGKATTDANGDAKVMTPDGSAEAEYVIGAKLYAKEVKAPKGYLLNAQPANVTVSSDETKNVFTVTDTPVFDPRQFTIVKVDENGKTWNGDIDTAGTKFLINYYDTTITTSGDTEGLTPERSWTFAADENGIVKYDAEHLVEGDELYLNPDGDPSIPLGSITVEELDAPKGLLKLEGKMSANITQATSGSDARFVWTAENATYRRSTMIADETIDSITNAEIYADFTLTKEDKEHGTIQGGAKLAGTEFTVYNRSKHAVTLKDGTAADVDAVITVLTIGEDLTAKLAGLPYGTYEVVETKAAEGYMLSDYKKTFTIEGENLAEKAGNDVLRGGVRIEKYDPTNEPQNVDLSKVVFAIINRTGNEVIVDGTTYANNAEVARISPVLTDGKWIAETSADLLPFGNYGFKEVAAADGYVLDDTEYPFAIREDGVIVEISPYGEKLELRNNPYRAHLAFNKVAEDRPDEEPAGMSVPFLITNVKTGEQHIILTDKSGIYNSKDYPHTSTEDTNLNDGFIGHGRSEDDRIDLSQLKECGLWFGDQNKITSDLGSLEIGSYTMEELYCTSNRGYHMLSYAFTVGRNDQYGANFITLTNLEDPRILTTALGKETLEHVVLAYPAIYLEKNPDTDTTTTIIDTVRCYNLVPGDIYTLKASFVYATDDGTKINNNGVTVTGTKTFVAQEADYEDIDIEMTFNADDTFLIGNETHDLTGRTGVVYEKLFSVKKHNGRNVEKEVASHEEATDEDQSIHFPKITSNAADMFTQDNVGTINPDGSSVIVDSLAYENVVPGKTYYLVAKLFDKATGEDTGITNTISFTATESAGTVDNTIPFQGEEGKTYVVYERMYVNSVADANLVAIDENIDNENQTVYFPSMKTVAHDDSTMDHVGNTSEDRALVDAIELKNLVPGKEYTLTGKLYDADTGLAIEADGKNTTEATITFTADAAEKEVEFTYPLETTKKSGKTIVVYSWLAHNDVNVLTHEDKTDEDESVHYINVWTTAVEESTADHVGNVRELTTIYDDVEYRNTLEDMEYVIEGYLVNKTESEKQGKEVPLLDKDGNKVTATATLKANEHAKDGVVRLTFVFDSSLLAGESVVAFERVKHNNIEIATHTDLEDEDQTVHFPEIKTSARDGKTGDDVGTVNYDDNTYTIIDTVTYKNLIPGEQYEITGILMDQHTKEPFRNDQGEVTATTGLFTATAADGSVEIPFTFKGLPGAICIDEMGNKHTTNGMEGVTLVVFEKLYHPNAETGDMVEVHRHEDITDKGQTIHYPGLETNADDEYTKVSVGTETDVEIVHDIVTYHNLVIGREYTIEGVLHKRDVKNGKDLGELVIDGKPVTASATFVAGTENDTIKVTSRDEEDGFVDGTVLLTFTFNSSALENETLVAEEKLIHKEVTVGVHADITDEPQSIHYPKIRTQASDGLTTDEVGSVVPNDAESADDTIRDHVLFWNLVPGETYKVSGTIMDKDTEQALLIGGQTVTVSKTFTAEVADSDTYHGEYADTLKSGIDGYIDLEYSLKASDLGGKTIVVFEKLIHVNGETGNETEVTTHEDINDKDQTLHYPEIKTEASDGKTKDHVGTVEKEATIVDVVTYTNLVKGKEYTLRGTVHKKDAITGEDLGVLKDASGAEVAQTVTFTAGETDPNQAVLTEEEVNGRIRVSGTYTITFSLDSSLLEGQTAVVFEDLLHNDVPVFSHGDITDKDQTIHYPMIRTVATDEQTGSHVGAIVGEKINSLVEREAGDKAVITDTVKYWNLIPGMTYEFAGTLMNKNTGEKIVDCDEPVTLLVENPDGEVTLTFTLDTAELTKVGLADSEGIAMVAFEKLFHGVDDAKEEDGSVDKEDRVEVTRHEDLSDADQSIYEANIITVAADNETGDQVGVISKTAKIKDIITFEQLVAGYEYTIKGVAKIRGTDTIVSTNEITFTAGEEAEGVEYTEISGKNENEVYGNVTLLFDVDSTVLEGKTVVVYEYLLVDDVIVTAHPVSEEEIRVQSVYYPTGKTNATDNKTKAHTSDAAEKTTITDRVYFQNLITGKEYTIEGTLMNKKTGKPLGIAGSTASVTFTADAANEQLEDVKTVDIDGTVLVSGYINLVFTISTKALAGESAVTFEKFKHNGVEIFVHEDLEDKCQTVKIPKISTEAKVEDLDEGSLYDEEGKFKDIVIVDTVKYENLWTQAELDELAEQGRTIKNGAVEFAREGFVYTINEDATYTVTGILMVKETGKALTNKAGKTYTASATFKPEKNDGSVDVVFTINGNDFIDEDGTCLIEGKTLVVFEDLYLGAAPSEEGKPGDEPGTEPGTEPETPDNHIGEHHDIEDDAQDIRIPKGRTHSVDTLSKDALDEGHENDTIETHEVLAAKDMSLTDRVSYVNLHGGVAYELTGRLMDKDTGKPILDDEGNEITKTITFTPAGSYEDEVSGTVDITFEFSGVKLQGKKIVTFETVRREGQLVFVHADLTDKAQTTYVPKIETTAIFEENPEDFHEGIAEDAEHKIYDRVDYENLEAGQTYVVKGILMDQETGEPVLVDDKEVTAETEFVAGEGTDAEAGTRCSGSVTLEFTVTTKTLEGTTVVAFEELYDNEKKVAIHTDIEDEDQSIDFPKVRTHAKDGKNGTQEQEAAVNATIVDVVSYNNLHVGEEYRVDGTLMVKSTGKPLTYTKVVLDEEGKEVKDEKGNVVTIEVPVTATTTFTPEEPDGTVELTFTFNSSLLAGVTVVAFEKMYREDILVGVHEDLTDEDQSVNIIRISTRLEDVKSGSHKATLGDAVQLVDHVDYKGLTPGKEYRVSGTLMDKATGQPLMQNGQAVTATTTFKPEKADGTADITFTVNTNAIHGKSVVAFEELYNGVDVNAVLIAEHKDINDKEQTVDVPNPPTPPGPPILGVTNSAWMSVLAILAGVAMLLFAALFLKRRKRA